MQTPTEHDPPQQGSPAPPQHAALTHEVAHLRPHAPQWAGVLAVFTSQPLDGSSSQLAKAPLHMVIWQDPPRHTSAALASAQARPQPPQWVIEVRVSTSQPLAALPSQLAKPAAQAPIRHPP